MNKTFCDCDPCEEASCGHGEPVFEIEPMPDDPATLHYNVNGASVWYDHTPVTKATETATSITLSEDERVMRHHGERSTQTISARELGSILHVADLGDVDPDSINDHSLLVYQKDPSCGDGCEGFSNGWAGKTPTSVGKTSIEYILGSDGDGALASLMPPTSTSKFSYLAWAAQDKAKWTTPTQVATLPTDSEGYQYILGLDPNTGEIVVVKEKA